MGKKHTFTWIDADPDDDYMRISFGAKRSFPTKAGFLAHTLRKSYYIQDSLLDCNDPEAPVEGDPLFDRLLGLVEDGYIRGAVFIDYDDGKPVFGWSPEAKPGRGHVHCWKVDVDSVGKILKGNSG